MTKRISSIVLIFLLGMLVFFSCNSKVVRTMQPQTTLNSKAAQKKPYLLLISLDGFRWDYLEKYKPPNLSAFVENGIKAEALIPAYPTKTFPNHYTIATGLYPENHGILGNSFYSHEKKMVYNYKDKTTATDGAFYKGSPIWLEANKANMVTASYFFVGTEAPIQRIHPTYFHAFDASIKNEIRVNQALNWLEMPEETRPHLIMMYFGDIDKVGHDFGPSNEAKLKKVLFDLDKNLGDLFKGVAETGLPVNVLIVSDHGMVDQTTVNLIPTESIENDSLYLSVDNGSIVNIYPKENVDIDGLLNDLKQKENHFKVYTTENTPGFEYVPKNKDWGSIQLVPDYGYYFLPKARKDLLLKNEVKTIGVHGYDPMYKDMHGIFYASGPAFKNGSKLSPLESIHIYPLMCEILGLKPPKTIDGSIGHVKSVLK